MASRLGGRTDNAAAVRASPVDGAAGARAVEGKRALRDPSGPGRAPSRTAVYAASSTSTGSTTSSCETSRTASRSRWSAAAARRRATPGDGEPAHQPDQDAEHDAADEQHQRERDAGDLRACRGPRACRTRPARRSTPARRRRRRSSSHCSTRTTCAHHGVRPAPIWAAASAASSRSPSSSSRAVGRAAYRLDPRPGQARGHVVGERPDLAVHPGALHLGGLRAACGRARRARGRRRRGRAGAP